MLDDRVALVTGAAGGIGAATAILLAARGARVVLADLNVEAARRIAKIIQGSGGLAEAHHVDLSEEASIASLIETTVGNFKRLDILHNNAADLSAELTRRDLDVESMATEVWDRTFRVNVRGTMLCCRHALRHMTAMRSGSIINTASNLGMQGNIGQAAYAASKAAVLQMTRSIAASHGRLGIRCNAVSPGLVMTPAARDNLPPLVHEIVSGETLTPYLGTPEDIAAAVLFLASDEARYITGHNLVVDGGTVSHVPGFARFREMAGKA
ncbi:MAG TPA: SDR family oxidoreductase [Steroidobacteraceae bacterium]|jgi:NAD(P)-dependent dehydrogenase (short-subunit alcohol dehydrogenase family)